MGILNCKDLCKHGKYNIINTLYSMKCPSAVHMGFLFSLALLIGRRVKRLFCLFVLLCFTKKMRKILATIYCHCRL